MRQIIPNIGSIITVRHKIVIKHAIYSMVVKPESRTLKNSFFREDILTCPEKIYFIGNRRYTSSRREDILIWQVSNTWQVCTDKWQSTRWRN